MINNIKTRICFGIGVFLLLSVFLSSCVKSVPPLTAEDLTSVFSDKTAIQSEQLDEKTQIQTEAQTETEQKTNIQTENTDFNAGAFSQPVKMPDGMAIKYTYSNVDCGDYNIAVADCSYEDRMYITVCRLYENGDNEVLYSVLQTPEQTQTIFYTENSYEKSDGKMLYFTMQDSVSMQSSLYFFSTVTEYFSYILEEPCSNFVIKETDNPEIAGLGWIVYDEYIVPINLADGSSYEAMTVRLSDLGEFSEIDNSFFTFTKENVKKKFVLLEDMENNSLLISVIELNNKKEQIRYDFEYDCINKTLFALYI